MVKIVSIRRKSYNGSLFSCLNYLTVQNRLFWSNERPILLQCWAFIKAMGPQSPIMEGLCGKSKVQHSPCVCDLWAWKPIPFTPGTVKVWVFTDLKPGDCWDYLVNWSVKYTAVGRLIIWLPYHWEEKNPLLYQNRIFAVRNIAKSSWCLMMYCANWDVEANVCPWRI